MGSTRNSRGAVSGREQAVLHSYTIADSAVKIERDDDYYAASANECRLAVRSNVYTEFRPSAFPPFVQRSKLLRYSIGLRYL